jgi:voltage-gated potassium channel
MRAGADEVVTPYGLTGRRMAVLAVQPSVLEVLDLLNLGSDIRLEEVAVQAGTHLDSLTIAEARALRRGRHPRAEKAGQRGLGQPRP